MATPVTIADVPATMEVFGRLEWELAERLRGDVYDDLKAQMLALVGAILRERSIRASTWRLLRRHCVYRSGRCASDLPGFDFLLGWCEASTFHH